MASILPFNPDQGKKGGMQIQPTRNALRSILILACVLMPVSCTHANDRKDTGLGVTQAAADASANEAQSAADAAAMAGAAAAGAHKGPKLELLLLDKQTGKPIAGARTHLSDRAGMGMTNETGRDMWYLDDDDQSGEIIIRCPAKRSSGRRILKVPFVLNEEMTQVTGLLDMTQCIEPQETSVNGLYSGYFSRGFENSHFRPCNGLPKDAVFGNDYSGGAWVDYGEKQWKQLKKLLPAASDALERGVYVEWEGTMTGPGSYGHLGGSAYHFEAKRVKKASLVFPATCPPPA